MPRDVGLPAVAPDETEPNQTEDAGPYLGVKLDYKFFYAETDEMKAEARAREQARAARDVERQRRKIAKQMETYSHLSGTVYLPNGETASNAAILLPVQGESAVLGDRRFEYETYSFIYRTASNGAFVIPEIPGVDLLYLAHEEGFCEFKVDHPQSPLSIHLLPWGRLEGVVTLEGKQRQKNTLHFGLAIEANGSFRINDVPPGTYELRGELREGGANNLPWAGKVLGRVNQEVLVLERAPDKLNEPLDLGEMVLQLVKNLKPGDAAPDFEIENLDGSSVRLADFRGKCLLLDFWATWCGPCRAETPHLKAVYDTYGKNPKFTMLGLSLDKAIEEPKGYSKTEGIAWQQGFLGDWSKATLPARYGVEGIPAICLVAPAGKIVATDLRGAEIGKAVAEALEEAEKASTK